ncbi:MAG: hypothetical protein BGO09_08245 [Bacteroidetes bacterium 47-18]|nr:MAG: hypothetical protein BGO09_08245 [Bacteroidetes bacterium 47-18]
MKWHNLIEILLLLLTSLWGVVQGEVTVFYIIYLFWFQELVRTVINVGYAYANGMEDGTKPIIKDWYGNFFILFVYVIFIILLFGFMLNWGNLPLMSINMQTLFFRNWSFNINLVLFAVQYFLYRKHTGTQDFDLKIFNRNHIILHVSIITGALLQMMVVKKYPEYFSGDVLWGSALVVMPFLLLKIWIAQKE